jgi:hypothetical protein
VDGNTCKWISTNLEWELYYSETDLIWLLVNYETEQVFFLVVELWDCVGANTLDEVGGGGSITVTPANECGGGGVDTECCSGVLLPETVNVIISGVFNAPVALIGTHAVTWNGISQWQTFVNVGGDDWIIAFACVPTGLPDPNPPYQWQVFTAKYLVEPPERDDAFTPTADAICEPLGFNYSNGLGFFGAVEV